MSLFWTFFCLYSSSLSLLSPPPSYSPSFYFFVVAFVLFLRPGRNEIFCLFFFFFLFFASLVSCGYEVFCFHLVSREYVFSLRWLYLFTFTFVRFFTPIFCCCYHCYYHFCCYEFIIIIITPTTTTTIINITIIIIVVLSLLLLLLLLLLSHQYTYLNKSDIPNQNVKKEKWAINNLNSISNKSTPTTRLATTITTKPDENRLFPFKTRL